MGLLSCRSSSPHHSHSHSLRVHIWPGRLQHALTRRPLRLRRLLSSSEATRTLLLDLAAAVCRKHPCHSLSTVALAVIYVVQQLSHGTRSRTSNRLRLLAQSQRPRPSHGTRSRTSSRLRLLAQS